jgi:hypothetical protein
MRQPLRSKSPRAQVSDVLSTPAPIGGWNARDALANMPVQDAYRLVNWYPTTSDVKLRGGRENYATGITGTVETLAVYNAMDGTSELYAVSDSDVYDVSNSGTATAKSATVTDGKFQTINFGDGTNNYLMMVNGVDKPLFYNGTTWVSVDAGSTPALTGLTSTEIVHINEYKGRLIFTEKDSLSFWYLPAGFAGGALTEFDLSSLCSRGGYLMWCATWSFDGGDGPDDACVFMTSEGEVIVYRGTNPSTAADWVLTGVYFIGKPLGRRSFLKLGGDLAIITQNGVFPLSAALQSADVNNARAITNKIETAFNLAASNYGTNFGWEGVVYPKEEAVIFNIPYVEGGEHKQYVMNTNTGAWCEFNSWNGECFVEYNKELYFGYSGGVRKAWTGTSDGNATITAIGKTAFNYFGNASQVKRFTLFRPLLRANGSFTFYTGLDIDYTDNAIAGSNTFTAPAAALWGTAVWGSSVWVGDLQPVRQWTSPSNNTGYVASGGIRVETDTYTVRWIANDYVYERGGVL